MASRYFEISPSGLTADTIGLITGHYGLEMPSGRCVRIKDIEILDRFAEDMTKRGFQLRPVTEAEALPGRMNRKELLIMSGWFRDQTHEARSFRGG
tara:strand:- start:3400 stop:3687 length:288 start_codon:yes stop_codon:yes gene_type:complete